MHAQLGTFCMQSPMSRAFLVISTRDGTRATPIVANNRLTSIKRPEVKFDVYIPFQYGKTLINLWSLRLYRRSLWRYFRHIYIGVFKAICGQGLRYHAMRVQEMLRGNIIFFHNPFFLYPVSHLFFPRFSVPRACAILYSTCRPRC